MVYLHVDSYATGYNNKLTIWIAWANARIDIIISVEWALPILFIYSI